MARETTGWTVHTIARDRRVQMVAVVLLVALLATSFQLWRMRVTSTSANTFPDSTAPLLPGETLWNGSPSYLFGNNDAFPWGDNTMNKGTYATAIQTTLRAQHIPIIRQWFFQNYNGVTPSDADQLHLAQIVHAAGAVCFAQLYTTNTEAYDLHLVSLLKGKCELYEVMNEPDSNGVSAAQYSAFWNSFVPKARAIDPKARFGGPATTGTLGYDCVTNTSGNQTCFLERWLQAVTQSRVYPDFVTFHWYTCWNQDAKACLAEAPKIKTVGDSTIAMVKKYLPGRKIPVGMTEWNANPGNPSYQYDDLWMQQYEAISLAGLERSNLSFAMQFDIGSYAGYGSLDLFNVGANGKERPYGIVWANEIAREINGGTAPSSTLPAVSGPIFAGFTPTSGSPGTQVTITGKNFTGATRLVFNGFPSIAPPFTVVSDTEIKAMLPTSAPQGWYTPCLAAPRGENCSSRSFNITAPAP